MIVMRDVGLDDTIECFWEIKLMLFHLQTTNFLISV